MCVPHCGQRDRFDTFFFGIDMSPRCKLVFEFGCYADESKTCVLRSVYSCSDDGDGLIILRGMCLCLSIHMFA